MSRFRPSGLAILATIFVVTGFGLMVASLRVESTRGSSTSTEAAAAAMIPTIAPVATVTATVAASQPKATRLFTRAQNAGRNVAYAGVKQITRWDGGKATTVTVTIDHAPGHGTVVTQNNGAADATGTSSVSVEPAADDESATLAALVANYRLAADGSDRMIGRDVSVVAAYRADDSVAARFWIDDSTGLVLRRELVDTDGRPTETSTYVRVAFGADAVSTPTATPVPAWSVVSDADVEALRAAGWTIPPALEGGQRLYQVREQQQGGDSGRILQLSYTDGLSAMSVFLQQGVLRSEAMTGFVPVTIDGGEVWVRSGALFYAWHAKASPAPSGTSTAGATLAPTRDIVVSVLADSSHASVASVLAMFPPLPAQEDGVGDRLSRGVSRVGSWIDPLN